MRKGSDNTVKEEQLMQLFASLRVTETPEAGFEDRFLYDFHERVAQAAVVRPARYQLWEHLMQALTNFGGRRLAYGASSLGIGVFALAFFALPGGEPSGSVASAALSRFDSTLTSLTPGLSRDFDSCTSICVEKQKNPFAHESAIVAVAGTPRADANEYTSSTSSEKGAWEAAAKSILSETGTSSF